MACLKNSAAILTSFLIFCTLGWKNFPLLTIFFYMETIIQKALKLLLDKFGADYDCVMVSEEDGHYRANIECANPARLIGKNGETLNSIQTLLKNILFTQNKENVFLSVDVDGYRKTQEDRIISKAEYYLNTMRDQNLAEIKLPPMNPYFRRLVHMWVLNNFPELQSDSTGEGQNRAVRIFHR